MTNTIHAQGGICPSLSVFFMRHVFNKGNRCVPIGTLKGLFKRFNPFLKGKRKKVRQRVLVPSSSSQTTIAYVAPGPSWDHGKM